MEHLLQRQVILAPYTTFNIGGPAEWFIAPSSRDEFCRAVVYAQKRGWPIFVIGGGSNIIVDDEGLPGLTIWTGKMKNINLVGDYIEAECGVSLPKLAHFAASHGWGGYDFLVGIPGTVGGGIVMNSGIGQELHQQIAFLVERIFLVDYLGKELELGVEDIKPTYRSTTLRKGDCFVLAAKFKCFYKDDPQYIFQLMKLHLEKRRSTQPLEFPSAGSIFKNPSADRPAWWYIREAGLCGYKKGRAQVSQKHANWVVNIGNASAKEVKELISIIIDKVKACFGIELEREVIFLPEDVYSKLTYEQQNKISPPVVD